MFVTLLQAESARADTDKVRAAHMAQMKAHEEAKRKAAEQKTQKQFAKILASCHSAIIKAIGSGSYGCEFVIPGIPGESLEDRKAQRWRLSKKLEEYGYFVKYIKSDDTPALSISWARMDSYPTCEHGHVHVHEACPKCVNEYRNGG